MYIRKAEYFQKKYKEKDCASGIITSSINGLIIGTPCIAVIKPFFAHDKPRSLHQSNTRANDKENWAIVNGVSADELDGLPNEAHNNQPISNADPEQASDEEVPIGQPFTSLSTFRGRTNSGSDARGPQSIDEQMASPVTRKASLGKRPKEADNINKIKAIDIYSMDTNKANCTLHNSLGKVQLLFLHSLWSGPSDYHIERADINKFYFTGVKPIMYDNCLRVEAEQLSDVHDHEEMKSFCDIIESNLKEYRYINYVFSNIVSANARNRLSDIYSVKDALSKKWPNTVCFFQYPGFECRSLVDTISVSFYRLSDTIAVFDSRKASGVCMEVLMLSKSTKDIAYPDKTMSWRFLFSKHRDNLFTIDGEKIQRPSDISVSHGFKYITDILVRNVANDKALKSESANASR